MTVLRCLHHILDLTHTIAFLNVGLVLPMILTVQENTFPNGLILWPHCHSALIMHGTSYHNGDKNFSLEIPEGAIPVGESITIDIGVALYGPCLRPVSPVLWRCVREKKFSQFLKPVTVTVSHFLSLENDNDIESLELSFLKGDHEMNSQQMYQFQPAEGKIHFEPLKNHGMLQTTHFCCLCISSRSISCTPTAGENHELREAGNDLVFDVPPLPEISLSPCVISTGN